MRRLAVVFLMILAVGAAPGVSGPIADSAAAADLAAASLRADFNNDGFADLAVGTPDEDAGSIEDAGTVNVLYGSAGGLTGSGSQTFTQNTPGVGSTAEAFDSFGSALATGDFDNDGFFDLAVGVPGEDIGSAFEAGAVNVLYGGAAGLNGSGSQTSTQNTSGVGSTAEAFDRFGSSLAAGDFDHDGFGDLAVGAPLESVERTVQAGAVNVLYGGAAGLTGSGSQTFTQNTSGVGSTAEAFDGFGSSLAAGDFDHDGFADLAVGVPGESSSISDIGAVSVVPGGAAGLTGSGSRLLTQNTPGVGSAGETGDRFGFSLAAGDFDNDGFADLAVGTPLESTSVARVGAVNVLYGSAAGLAGSGSQLLTQNTPGVGSTAETGDVFGYSLAVGDSDNDGLADLTVGAPGEDIGSASAAGAVNVLYGGAAGLTSSGSQTFTQNTPGVGSTAETGDEFGYSLAAGDFRNGGFADLAVGVPGESIGGAVNVLSGSAAGLTGSGSRFVSQDTPGVEGIAETGDGFGFTLAASGP
jgi:hypothetical protein